MHDGEESHENTKVGKHETGGCVGFGGGWILNVFMATDGTRKRTDGERGGESRKHETAAEWPVGCRESASRARRPTPSNYSRFAPLLPSVRFRVPSVAKKIADQSSRKMQITKTRQYENTRLGETEE